MHWLLLIENELQRIRPDGNPGRTRTIARRIAGIALQQYYKNSSDDFLRVLQTALSDDAMPANVRSAIERLATRLDHHFHSPSIDPIGDATMIVEFVMNKTA